MSQINTTSKTSTHTQTRNKTWPVRWNTIVQVFKNRTGSLPNNPTSERRLLGPVRDFLQSQLPQGVAISSRRGQAILKDLGLGVEEGFLGHYNPTTRSGPYHVYAILKEGRVIAAYELIDQTKVREIKRYSKS